MRKNLCIVLILLICFTTTFTYIVKGTDEEGNSNTTTSSTDLQTQKELLQKQLNEANANLSEIETDISDNLQQIQKLDERISNGYGSSHIFSKKALTVENGITLKVTIIEMKIALILFFIKFTSLKLFFNFYYNYILHTKKCQYFLKNYNICYEIISLN